MDPSVIFVRVRRWAIAGVALGAVAFASIAQAAGSVSIVGGTSDPVKVQVKDKPKADDYFGLSPGGDRLMVTAHGPTTLSIRFRATGPGKLSGKLRILRDNGPFSDNSYELAHDDAATPDFNSAIDENAITVERVIHVPVAAGEHRYQIAALKGPPLLVRVFKTSKFDRALASAPEKNTSVDTSAEAEAKPPENVEKEPAPPPKQAPPATPDLEIERAPDTVTAAPAEQAAQPPTAILEEVTNAEELPEKPVLPPDPNLHTGLGIGIRTGTLGFLGFRENQSVSTGPAKLSNRLWSFTPIALELAWDINGYFSLFLEGSNVRATRTFTTSYSNESGSGHVKLRSDYRLTPALLGVTAMVPFASRLDVRFRLGLGMGFASALSSPTDTAGIVANGTYETTWLLTGTAGVAFEVRVGPGRFSLEARYLAAPTTWLEVPSGPHGVNALPPDLGGIQGLAGYRFELF